MVNSLKQNQKKSRLKFRIKMKPKPKQTNKQTTKQNKTKIPNDSRRILQKRVRADKSESRKF